jgi:hypothetical protein
MAITRPLVTGDELDELNPDAGPAVQALVDVERATIDWWIDLHKLSTRVVTRPSVGAC